MRLAASLLLLCALFAGASTAAWRSWRALPLADAGLRRFDLILVLGAPCRPNGAPSPEQRERVLEAVRDWRAGQAPYLLLSGAAAHNRWVEADSMARIARAAGVPADAILEDRQARNTVENVANTYAVMQARGWRSVEVVSSPSHLPRAGLILARFPLLWRTDAAQWPPEMWPITRWAHEWVEAEYCLRIRWFGFPSRQAVRLPAKNATAPPPASAPPNR